MKDFSADIKEIYTKERALFYLMIFVAVISAALFVYSILSLTPGSSVVKIGYGDIGRYQGGAWSSMANSGGYHDGGWWNIAAFSLFAVVFGFLHNMIAVKLYKRKSPGVAKAFMAITVCLVLATFVVLVRLLSEG